MSSLLECPICLEKDWDVAKALECRHWICAVCAARLIADDGSVQCPECRHVTVVNEGNLNNLPNDLSQQKLREFLRQDEETKDDFIDEVAASECASMAPQDGLESQLQHTCSNDSRDAAYKCHNCAVYLCTPCQEKHNSRDLFKGHDIVGLESATCVAHGRYCIYICKQCPCLLCGLCVQTMCVEHDSEVYQISSLAPSAETDLENLIANINDQLHIVQEVQSAKTQARSQLSGLDDTKRLINSHTEKLMEDLRHNRDALITKVDTRHTSLMEVLHTNDEVFHTQDVLKHLLTKAQDKISSTTSAADRLLAIACLEADLPVSVDRPDLKQLQTKLKFEPKDVIGVGNVVDIPQRPINSPRRSLRGKPRPAIAGQRFSLRDF